MDLFSLLKKSVWFGIIPKLPTFINILILPFVTPYLTANDYGVWGIISSYTGIFISIYTLGLHMHLSNSYYEYGDKYRYVWGRILYLLLVLSVFFSCILFFIIWNTFDNLEFSNRFLLALLSVFSLQFNANNLIGQQLYTLRGTPIPFVSRTLIGGLIGITTTFVSIRYFKMGYLGFVLGSALNYMFCFFSFIRPLWLKEKLYPRFEVSKTRIANLLKISLPVVPHALGFMLLSSSSRIIMDWYEVPIADIGIYSNGYMLGDYITIVTTALVSALAPYMQTSFRSENYVNYRFLFMLCQSIALLSIFIFCLWMPEIYSILIRNESLQKSMIISQISCFANCIFPLYVFMSSICFIEKTTMQLLWLVFIPGILNIILLLIFIPLLGYKVAVITTLVSYWTQMLIPFFVKHYKKQITLWLGSRYKLIALFFTSAFLLICSVVVSEFFIYKLLLTLIILIVVVCNINRISIKFKSI